MKPSSRQSPYIRFDQDKKLHRLALEIKGLGKCFEEDLFTDLSLTVKVGERIAVIGPNGIGKTTLAKNVAQLLDSEKDIEERFVAEDY